MTTTTRGAPDRRDRLGGYGTAPDIPTARLLDRAIPRRRTNRRPFLDLVVPPEALADLHDAAAVEGSRLAFLDPALRRHARPGPHGRTPAPHRPPVLGRTLGQWTRDEPGRRDGAPRAAFGPWPVLESIPLRDFGLELPDLRELLTAAAGGFTAQAIVRFGYGPPSSFTARRHLAEVLMPSADGG